MAASEGRRRLFHAGMGLFALLLAFLDWKAAALLALAALLFNIFAMPRVGHRISRSAPGRPDQGIVGYAAVVLVLILLYRHRLEIAAAIWGMLALGDPAAAIAGRRFPGSGLPWNRRKSWAGLLANFGVSAVTGLALFRFVAPASPMAMALAPPGLPAAIVTAAVAFALLESLHTGLEDNLVAPLPASLVLWGCLAAGPDAWRLLVTYPSFASDLIVAILVNAVLGVLLWRFRVVSGSGAAAGAIVGAIVLGLGGWGAYELLWAFFAVGTLATKLGYAAKSARGVAQAEAGRRGARHVFANCGVALAILIVAAGRRRLLPDAAFAAFAGAFAAALADTLGTEVGSLAGRRPRSPLSLERVPAGTPGAISWPGTLAGAAGAVFIGAMGFVAGLIPLALIPVVAAAGIAGSLAESALADLGARRGFRIDHEFANALNTFVGAAFAAEIAVSLELGRLYLPFES